jgi:hypothetical protein
VHPDGVGWFAAIDIESGMYEIDADELKADLRTGHDIR